MAESIEGETIDLDDIRDHSGWQAYGDKVRLISKDGSNFVATISVDTLITCWIEKEEEAYKEAMQ